MNYSRNNHPEFVANLGFRVNGPDGGDGSLHIWYEKEGRRRVGSSTIYTIDRFDGLALVIDNYGGKVRRKPSELPFELARRS